MRAAERGEAGSALVIVMIIMVVVIVLAMASLSVSTSEARSAVVARQRVQALFVAEAGLELQIHDLKTILGKGGLTTPFSALEDIAGDTTPVLKLMTKDEVSVGEFSATIMAVEVVDDNTHDVTIQSVGYVPSADAPNRVTRTVTASVRLQLERSHVFDYVYFVNNWGWFYGNTIYAEGNVRANGQFDCGNYSPTINGVPIYERVEGTDVQNLIGIGGIDAGWDIIADRVQGTAKQTWTQGDADAGRCAEEEVGEYKYQHEFLEPLTMPNLTDLSAYEEEAKQQGSWIKVGDQLVCGPVLGDEAGEQQHLFLQGTAAAPIHINGTVVVRGDVIISGVVKGQGTIYSKGNVYVPQNLTYENGPQPLPSPSGRTESALENWLAHNEEKDFLGLFAREHVVVGDYTNSTWRSYVNGWLRNSKNKSEEDAGQDLIPNTKAGRDGIDGTADDDVLEDDGEWTVDRYTEEDAEQGLIPEGKQVGDVIPGSGEDIDGDGQFDGTASLAEFDLPKPLARVYWAGNLPGADGDVGASAVLIPDYSDIASMNVYRLDGAFYTNHVFAMVTLARNKHLNANGCIISRNESIIYGTQSVRLNYDYRLMGSSLRFGASLPKTWKPIQVLIWTSD